MVKKYKHYPCSFCGKSLKSRNGKLYHEAKTCPSRPRTPLPVHTPEPAPTQVLVAEEENEGVETSDSNEVEEKEEEESEGLIPKIVGFPTREKIFEAEKENFVSKVTEKAQGVAGEYFDGGLIWICVKSVAAFLTSLGEHDYLEALKPVERQLKLACAKSLSPAVMKRIPPAGQVAIYVGIAWIPLILSDIPNMIPKIFSWFTAMKNLKKDKTKPVDIEAFDLPEA